MYMDEVRGVRTASVCLFRRVCECVCSGVFCFGERACVCVCVNKRVNASDFFLFGMHRVGSLQMKLLRRGRSHAVMMRHLCACLVCVCVCVSLSLCVRVRVRACRCVILCASCFTNPVVRHLLSQLIPQVCAFSLTPWAREAS